MLASIDIRIEKPQDNNFRVYMLILATLLLALTMIFINQQESFTSVGRLVQSIARAPDQQDNRHMMDLPLNSVIPASSQPTSISLIYFDARLNQDGTLILSWETGVEINSAGFYLYRSSQEAGPWERIHPHLIPAQGGLVGTTYTYTDNPESTTGTVYYTLEEVDVNNNINRSDPVAICIGCDQISMP